MKTKTLTKFLLASFICAYGITAFAQTIKLEADINKVPVDSEIEAGVTYNGKYYYAASKPHGSAYLYEYDGTNKPKMAPGVTGASNEAGRNPEELILFKGKLYFQGYVPWKGNELISYDFSSTPKLVADIYSTGQSSSSPSDFAVFNNKLYFAASEALTGRELYEYDGVNPPKVIDVIPGLKSIRPKELTVYRNKLYFQGTDENFDVELYEYDGVNPPRKYNIQPSNTGNSNSISGKPEYLTVYNDTLYFRARGADNITDLYKFSPEDSFRVAHIYPGARRHTYPTNLEVWNNKLYFSGIPQWGPYDLIEYDGTNTPKVYKLNGTSNSSPHNLKAVGNNLFFAAVTAASGVELFIFRMGTSSPRMVMDMMPGNASSAPSGLVNFNGRVLYVAKDPVNGRELRQYNGHPKSSVSLVIDHSPGSGNSRPIYHSEYKGKMYFNADDGKHGQELWMYDGTNPASMVSDFYTGTRGSEPGQGVVYNDKLYFRAKTGYLSAELIEFNGDTSIPVTKLASGNGTYPQELAVFNGKLYFSGRTLANGTELMSYDGDTAVVVADIFPGTKDSRPRFLTVYKGKLYFNAQGDANGNQLWSYDGTNAPTKVGDINSGSSANVSYLTVFKDVLYFGAQDGTNSNKSALWKFNGTGSPEKVTVSNLYYVNYLKVYRDMLYMSAWKGSNQPELYAFDGENEPVLVEDINPGTSGSSPTDLEEYNGKMYFAASNSTTGREIWSLDGYGTNYFDYVSGSNGLNPQYLFAFGDRLYFTGTSVDKGQELFSLKAPNTTSLSEDESLENIVVYPNPTTGILNISITNGELVNLQVINISGQVVKTARQVVSVDVSDLIPGVYMIKVESSSKVGYTKFIKQ